MARGVKRSQKEIISDKINKLDGEIEKLTEKLEKIQDEKAGLEKELEEIKEAELKAEEEAKTKAILNLIKSKGLTIDDVKILLESKATEE